MSVKSVKQHSSPQLPVPGTGIKIIACYDTGTLEQEYVPNYMKWAVFGFEMHEARLPSQLRGTASTLPMARDNILACVSAAVSAKKKRGEAEYRHARLVPAERRLTLATATLKRARNERHVARADLTKRTTKKRRVVIQAAEADLLYEECIEKLGIFRE